MNSTFAPQLAWRLSPQTYAWRTRDAAQGALPAFMQAGLDDAVAGNYDGVELNLSVLGSPQRAEALAEALHARSLRLAAVFATVGTDATPSLLRDVAKQAAAAAVLGCRLLNVATVSRAAQHDDADAVGTIDVLRAFSALLPTNGARIQWHPHEEHLARDAQGLQRVLDTISPDQAGICLDLGWVLKASGDPVSVIRRCRGRLEILHLRDCRNGVWSQSLGDGDLNLAGALDQLADDDFAGWLSVELWFDRATVVTRSLRENALQSAAAIRESFPSR